MTDRRSSQFSLAVHEAGHAVIAAVLGHVIEHVEIKPKKQRAPNSWAGIAMCYATSSIKKRARYRGEVIMTLAGPVAALDFCGVPITERGGCKDAKHIHQFLSRGHIEHEFNRLAAVARWLVRRHREAILRVAGVLLMHKRLTGDDIRFLQTGSAAEWRSKRRQDLRRRRRERLLEERFYAIQAAAYAERGDEDSYYG